MKVAIIGIGLIGGSLALALKTHKVASVVVGIDSNPDHCRQALRLGLVDEIMDVNDALDVADLVIISTPVSVSSVILSEILCKVKHQVIIDVGSTKNMIATHAGLSVNRGRFVATHPMWGTEFSGPEAAVVGAFTGKAVVIAIRINRTLTHCCWSKTCTASWACI